MYPEEILEAYSSVRRAADGWEAQLETHQVDAILLPPAAPLVRAATAEGSGWCAAIEDANQVLLLPCSDGG
jgi:hypothetical protein